MVFEVYRRYPDSFLSMILVATRPRYPPAQPAALEGMSMEIIGEEVATFALAASAPESLREEVGKMIAGTRKDIYIQSAEATSMLNYTDLLAKIRVPTLIIVGDRDIVTPVDSAELSSRRPTRFPSAPSWPRLRSWACCLSPQSVSGGRTSASTSRERV